MTQPEIPSDGTPAPPRKKTLLIALAVAAVLVVALSVTLVITGRGHKVRYEVESSSGQARLIGWANDEGNLDRAPDSPDEQQPTPFSTTETFEGSGKQVSIAADVDEGTASCRIFIDGTLAAEYQGERGAICEATIP